MESGAALLLTGRAIQLLNSFGWSVVLLKRFGLSMMGTFAVGVVAVTVLSTVSPLGLPSFLPRVRQPHARLCFAGITLHLALLPIIVSMLLVYAKLFAQTPEEVPIVFLVALSGFVIGSSNTGLMLSIMVERFYPAAVAPLFETVAIFAAAFSIASPKTVAAYMLLSRLAGALLVWSGMQISPMSLRRLTFVFRRSIGYLAPDAIATLSEQIAPFILQMVTTRAELGLFRLCQQMLNASDTPGWSYVQSMYPRLVRSNQLFFVSVERTVTRLAMVASVLCASCSAILVIWVYHLPVILPMMCLLSASLFWRYKNNLYDQGFRASGRVTTATALGAMKLFCAGVLFYFLIKWQGVWGAVVALTALSIVAGVGYEWVYARPTILARVPS
ncbi:MAG: hypothetical protein WBV55_15970 [Candidatus Sulfotelmatobacter sp.]